MIRLNLGKGQVGELERTFKASSDSKRRDRVQTVLMFHRGRTRQQIMADLAISDRTITRRLNAYLENGLEGLRPRKAPGATARIPEALAPEIRRWVIEGPMSVGVDRAYWTYAELAAHLGRVHRIKVKKSATAEFCRRHDIRPYRPSYRFLRGDPIKQAKAATDLAAFKKVHLPSPGSVEG